jgi:hypothetical protein
MLLVVHLAITVFPDLSFSADKPCFHHIYKFLNLPQSISSDKLQNLWQKLIFEIMFWFYKLNLHFIFLAGLTKSAALADISVYPALSSLARLLI